MEQCYVAIVLTNFRQKYNAGDLKREIAIKINQKVKNIGVIGSESPEEILEWNIGPIYSDYTKHLVAGVFYRFNDTWNVFMKPSESHY